MLTIEQCRKIQPELEDLSDEEVLELVEDMRGLAQLAFEKCNKENGSNNPIRVLQKD